MVGIVILGRTNCAPPFDATRALKQQELFLIGQTLWLLYEQPSRRAFKPSMPSVPSATFLRRRRRRRRSERSSFGVRDSGRGVGRFPTSSAQPRARLPAGGVGGGCEGGAELGASGPPSPPAACPLAGRSRGPPGPAGAHCSPALGQAAALSPLRSCAVSLPPAEPGARGRHELGVATVAAGAVRARRARGAAAALPAGRWRPDPNVGRVAGATPR